MAVPLPSKPWAPGTGLLCPLSAWGPWAGQEASGLELLPPRTQQQPVRQTLHCGKEALALGSQAEAAGKRQLGPCGGCPSYDPPRRLGTAARGWSQLVFLTCASGIRKGFGCEQHVDSVGSRVGSRWLPESASPIVLPELLKKLWHGLQCHKDTVPSPPAAVCSS